MKQQINFRASELTTQQLAQLMQLWGTTQTETLTVVIDRVCQQETRVMNAYTLDIVYEGGQSPIDGKWSITETETITVQADDIEHARRLAPVYSKVRGLGRWMRIYHNGTELLGNF